MKLRVVQCLAGSDYVHEPGAVVEFEDAEGRRLIDAGIAEPLSPETATEEPAENAAQPKGRKRVARAGDGADD